MDDETLRVVVERSGGFAGRVLRAELDASALPPEQAGQLAELVRRADVAGLAERGADAAPPGARGADRFSYDVSVEQGDRTSSLRVAEGAVPTEVRPLLDHVLASRRRP